MLHRGTAAQHLVQECRNLGRSTVLDKPLNDSAAIACSGELSLVLSSQEYKACSQAAVLGHSSSLTSVTTSAQKHEKFGGSSGSSECSDSVFKVTT